MKVRHKKRVVKGYNLRGRGQPSRKGGRIEILNDSNFSKNSYTFKDEIDEIDQSLQIVSVKLMEFKEESEKYYVRIGNTRYSNKITLNKNKGLYQLIHDAIINSISFPW